MLIRVIDFETTGLPPEASVCEIGWYDVVDGEVRPRSKGEMFVNPRREMSIEARATHHIRDVDLVGAPAIDTGFRALMEDRPFAFAAHNAAFEQQFFAGDNIPWICTLKVGRRLWPDSPSHTNQVLRYFLGLELEDALAMPPHRAAPDAFVTAHILARAMKIASPQEMIAWTSSPSLLPRVNFGKHRGSKWSQADMDPDVRFTAKSALADRR
jgi:exodeoxyribonuclease X